MVSALPNVYGAVPPMGIKDTLPSVCPLSIQTINVSDAEVVNNKVQHSVPVTTPPGATQLEVEPVNAKKLFSVALKPLPLASVSVVSVRLFPAAIPWLKL